MALKALVNGKPLCSLDLSLEEWRAVQAQKPPIRMYCCQTRGYMRIREEFQEFVHYRGTDDCLGRPDSPVHDLLKVAVMNAARANSWIADVEVVDPSSSRAWIADVLASKGRVRIAFELQISPIAKEVLRRWQNAYAQSGVRSCWFVKGTLADALIRKPERQMPVFKLTEDHEAELGSPRFYVSIVPNQRMPLRAAVGALLRGDFKWCPVRCTRTGKSIVIIRVRNCLTCSKPLGMYQIQATKERCGGSPERQLRFAPCSTRQSRRRWSAMRSNILT